ncbi:MAG: (Fe-S)-binding protein [Myxococcales bacterium]|nr:4Fe-4S dicluster domain-containing protein [Myxococcales bacterium]
MTAPERELIDDCVHCGFCLPHCPTYVSWGEEMDSPRGRIDLMRAVRTGASPMTPTVVAHFDRCLGCMACVTACPSGVRYDILIEETRAMVEKTYRRGLYDRLHRALIFSLFPYPRRLKALVALMLVYTWTGLRWLMRHTIVKLLPRRLREMEELQPRVTPHQLFATLPERTPARGEKRMTVALVAGCVQRVFYPGVNEATIRVLSAEGCEVLVPRDQGCCGALSMHAGREHESLEFARELMGKFEKAEAIVINAAGCGSHLKDYGRLLKTGEAKAFSAKVRDVNEFLAALPPRAERKRLDLRIAMHDACHLQHAQRIVAQPRELLSAIPGVTLLEIPDAGQCCGSAGIYNLVQPESADQIGARKVDNVLSTKPDLLASANPGCTLQIQKILRERGQRLPAAHPIEILDASISGRSGVDDR